MKKRLASIILVIAFVLLACIPTPAPTRSPVSPLSLLAEPINLLVNPGFDLPTHYQPKGEMGIVIPTGWKVWSLDAGGYLKLYEPAGMRQLGRYTQYRYGLRPGQDSEVLKAEILHIQRVEPYLDPLRIFEGDYSVTGFKLFGHVAWGVQQTISTIPGHVYRFTGYAHAWSRMSEDPNDAHYSHGVGTAPFYAEEGSPLLNDSNDNYRFRLCVDPFGSENVFSSAVYCAQGAIIYNVYNRLPPLNFTARADSVTVFAVVDSRFGMLNSNAYLDTFDVTDTTQPPTVTPTPTLTPTATSTPTPTNTPKPTYTPGPTPTPVPITWTLPCVLTMTQRVFVLLPPGSSLEWWQAALPVVAANGWSIGTSAIDSCINSCGGRVTLAVNAEQWKCNLAKNCVPACGAQGYVPLSAETPLDLTFALENYPAWLHEAKAWGLCLPLVVRP